MQANIQYITWLQISFTAKIMKQYQSLDSPERRKLRLGTRKTMIVALARKLVIALWRFVTTGETLEGVILRPAG